MRRLFLLGLILALAASPALLAQKDKDKFRCRTRTVHGSIC